VKLASLLIVCGVLPVAIIGETRTWTSADGAKSFEASFVGVEEDQVTIEKGGRRLTFLLSKLSTADVQWVRQEIQRLEAERASRPHYDLVNPLKIELQLSINGDLECYDGDTRQGQPAYQYEFICPPLAEKVVETGQRLESEMQYRWSHLASRASEWCAFSEPLEVAGDLVVQHEESGGICLQCMNLDLQAVDGDFIYDDKLRPFSKNPVFELRSELTLFDLEFKEDVFRLPQSSMANLELTELEGAILVPSSQQPPPDLLRKVLGEKKAFLKRSVGENLECICEGIRREFELVDKEGYSEELSYLYETRELPLEQLTPLFAAFTSVLGMPVREKEGFVITMKSGLMAQDAKVRVWQECHIPTMGWVPVDVGLFLRKPNLKRRYIANLVNEDALRLEFQGGELFKYRSVVKLQSESSGEYYFQERAFQLPVDKVKIKKLR